MNTSTVSAMNITEPTSSTTATMYLPPKPSTPRLTRTPMHPVSVTAKCPTKGCRGEMVAQDGLTIGFGPTHWRHTCTKCEAVATYTDSYPHPEYVPVKRKRVTP